MYSNKKKKKLQRIPQRYFTKSYKEYLKGISQTRRV